MPLVQREAIPEEDEEELQMMPLQRVAGGEGIAASPDLETSIAQARGGGQPLAQSIRGPIEQAMGADFSGVKVHTDAQADQLNRSIQAKAFATGQDMFFRQGQYNPGNRGGQELIAHELTHVVQQNGSAVQQPDLKPFLMKAQHYGHHLSRMQPARVSAPTVVQPKMTIQAKGEKSKQQDLGQTQSERPNVIQRALMKPRKFWWQTLGLKRGRSNPEILEIDSMLEEYRRIRPDEDRDKKNRFEILDKIEHKVYEWFDRKYNKREPERSKRNEAMYDLLDSIAEEHKQLVSQLVTPKADDVVGDLPLPGPQNKEMTPEENAEIQQMWQTIVKETGNINFQEKVGNPLKVKEQMETYDGFKKGVLPQIARLLRTKGGRQIIAGILNTEVEGLTDDDKANGMGKVTIRPLRAREKEEGRVGAAGVKRHEQGNDYYNPPEDQPGQETRKGIGSYLTTDHDRKETWMNRDAGKAARDEAGNEVLTPEFIVLGHELIHALHNLQGSNRNRKEIAGWSNEEEKVTITGKDSTENGVLGTATEQQLRNEHGLFQKRYGHNLSE